jgi:hypothetical protein
MQRRAAVKPAVRTISIVLTVASVLCGTPARGGDMPGVAMDTWRSPPGAPVATELPRERRDTGPTMPLMEISLILRLCRNPAFQLKAGTSVDECAKAMFELKRRCTKSFRRKFPRADNQNLQGRLTFRKFFEGYGRCLRKQYDATKSGRVKPAEQGFE